MFFVDTIAEMGKFMDSGGMVLWAIVVLLFFMWTLIFERMWYLRSSVSLEVQSALDAWEARKERKSKHAHQIREKLISEVSIEIDANMMMIKTLVAIAPLFGLLGTVTGMITVFDVMAFTGGGDAKAMAGGVSQATIPTMSGMVAALSGVFGMTYIERVAEQEKHLLEDHLTMDH
jgi:biopolymer transport protein ExbB|tara:strand:+ start:392 stop:916 length:525 start_codon:yes stop_codon:yes gene_type:complete